LWDCRTIELTNCKALSGCDPERSRGFAKRSWCGKDPYKGSSTAQIKCDRSPSPKHVGPDALVRAGERSSPGFADGSSRSVKMRGCLPCTTLGCARPGGCGYPPLRGPVCLTANSTKALGSGVYPLRRERESALEHSTVKLLRVLRLRRPFAMRMADCAQDDTVRKI
jgi:hypothetical protein